MEINDETLKAALDKVLEDVWLLKPQASGTTGFTIQVGATSGSQMQQTVDGTAVSSG